METWVEAEAWIEMDTGVEPETAKYDPRFSDGSLNKIEAFGVACVMDKWIDRIGLLELVDGEPPRKLSGDELSAEELQPQLSKVGWVLDENSKWDEWVLKIRKGGNMKTVLGNSLFG